MAKEVMVVSWCDYPDCADAHRESSPQGQDTTNVQVWLYVPGKGRKPRPIQIEVCEDHLAEMKALYAALTRFDQKVGAES